MNPRSCDGCAKCCEGWLHGEAHGHAFFKGRPCFFLNKTCAIYNERPKDPCRTFECEWLSGDIFPHWMKPDLVNVIIVKRKKEDIEYFEIVEAGSTLEAKTLSWLVQWSLNTKKNIRYFIDGGINKIGSQEFLKADI